MRRGVGEYIAKDKRPRSRQITTKLTSRGAMACASLDASPQVERGMIRESRSDDRCQVSGRVLGNVSRHAVAPRLCVSLARYLGLASQASA